MVRDQEQQGKCSDQLNNFQDIEAQLSVKAVAGLQAVKFGKKEINAKMVEQSLKEDRLICQDVVEKFKVQVAEISYKYDDFKAKTNEYTMSI